MTTNEELSLSLDAGMNLKVYSFFLHVFTNVTCQPYNLDFSEWVEFVLLFRADKFWELLVLCKNSGKDSVYEK